MSLYGPFTPMSFVAAADLSAKQFHIVKLDADGKVNLANAGNEQTLGVLQNAPQSGEAASVLFTPGETRVVVGGAVSSAGLQLASDANGLAVVATSGECAFATALQTAAGSGKIIRVLTHTSLPNVVLA